jgi:RHS repeat-associated protein
LRFFYDADGNLIQDDRWNYTWDAENRLIKQETRWQGASAIAGMPILRFEYKYDAYWRRVEKKISTWNSTSFQQSKLTKFAYDGWNLVAEWESLNSSTLNLARTHHWSPDLSGTLQGAGGVGGLVLTRHHASPGGQTSSYVPAYDGVGNVLALYDTATGKRAAKYQYGPFGEILRATGTMAKENPFRWSTKYCGEETALSYYGYRYYDPMAGRWLSRDPIGERGGNHLNRFVGNQPTHKIDSLGFKEKRTCEITILHGDLGDMRRWQKRKRKQKEPFQCGDGVGVVSCFANRINADISNDWPGHGVDGMPDIPGFMDAQDTTKYIAGAQAGEVEAEKRCNTPSCCKEVVIKNLCSQWGGTWLDRMAKGWLCNYTNKYSCEKKAWERPRLEEIMNDFSLRTGMAPKPNTYLPQGEPLPAEWNEEMWGFERYEGN